MRLYELASCRRTAAAASVDLLLPSATQPAAAPLTVLMSALGDCISRAL